MIFIFEGARNSGKTYLAKRASDFNNLPLYKFEFTKWFNDLDLLDNSKDTHLFALGKELQLLQANRDGILSPLILDRGFLTVLVWGVLSKRINYEEGISQLDRILESGLLENCKVYYIWGNNPDKSNRNKDNWDFRDNTGDEKELYEKFISHLVNSLPPSCNFSLHTFENKFDESSIIKEF